MFPHTATQFRAASTGGQGEWSRGTPQQIASGLRCLLSAPSAGEVRQADQFRGRLLYGLTFEGDPDVRSGDEVEVLAGTHEVRLRVETVLPGTMGYLRATGELYQRGGEGVR
ncbi:MAG: hypothetical protein R3349_03895 [Geminicoccaceae bacterium]|nr:hypothetical protein [Geminicoccaceae bacterium]